MSLMPFPHYVVDAGSTLVAGENDFVIGTFTITLTGFQDATAIADFGGSFHPAVGSLTPTTALGGDCHYLENSAVNGTYSSLAVGLWESDTFLDAVVIDGTSYSLDYYSALTGVSSGDLIDLYSAIHGQVLTDTATYSVEYTEDTSPPYNYIVINVGTDGAGLYGYIDSAFASAFSATAIGSIEKSVTLSADGGTVAAIYWSNELGDTSFTVAILSGSASLSTLHIWDQGRIDLSLTFLNTSSGYDVYNATRASTGSYVTSGFTTVAVS